MNTRQDAEAHIVEMIENAGRFAEDAAAEYDIDGIATTLYIASNRRWDINGLDPSTFWWVVQRHSNNEAEREATPDHPEDMVDQTAQHLEAARERVDAAREALRSEELEREQLLVRAYRTDGYSQKRLSQMSGLSQQRVSQILARQQ